jgi:hypothetical protein
MRSKERPVVVFDENAKRPWVDAYGNESAFSKGTPVTFKPSASSTSQTFYIMDYKDGKYRLCDDKGVPVGDDNCYYNEGDLQLYEPFG